MSTDMAQLPAVWIKLYVIETHTHIHTYTHTHIHTYTLVAQVVHVGLTWTLKSIHKYHCCRLSGTSWPHRNTHISCIICKSWTLTIIIIVDQILHLDLIETHTRLYTFLVQIVQQNFTSVSLLWTKESYPEKKWFLWGIARITYHL